MTKIIPVALILIGIVMGRYPARASFNRRNGFGAEIFSPPFGATSTTRSESHLAPNAGAQKQTPRCRGGGNGALFQPA